MYTIKRVAELTGISLSTLRAWERRYGVVTPQRSEGRYRLYSDADVRTLAIMAALVHDGWSASEAAAETLSRLGDGPRADGIRALADQDPTTPPSSRDPVGLADLVHAANDLHAADVARLLDQGLGGLDRGFDVRVSGWLLPTLSGIGDAWADGRLSVAGEHLTSYAVQRRLAAAYDATPEPAGGPAVIVGLPTGARHELGALAFAVTARRAGVRTIYIGADLPSGEWEALVCRQGAGAVVLAVPRAADVVPAQQIVERLAASAPSAVVAVGGGHQDRVKGAVHLGHDLVAGVEALRTALAGPVRDAMGALVTHR